MEETISSFKNPLLFFEPTLHYPINFNQIFSCFPHETFLLFFLTKSGRIIPEDNLFKRMDYKFISNKKRLSLLGDWIHGGGFDRNLFDGNDIFTRYMIYLRKNKPMMKKRMLRVINTVTRFGGGRISLYFPRSKLLLEVGLFPPDEHCCCYIEHSRDEEEDYNRFVDRVYEKLGEDFVCPKRDHSPDGQNIFSRITGSRHDIEILIRKAQAQLRKM